MFISYTIEFAISMRRIQQFLLLQEINETVVSSQPNIQSSVSVSISEPSNFFWYLKTSDDKKDKEEEHKKVMEKTQKIFYKILLVMT